MLASILIALALPGTSPAASRAPAQSAAEVQQLSKKPGEEAVAFAAAIAEVMESVQENLVVEATPNQLARLALRELFKLRSRPVPADLAQRLKEACSGDDKQLQRLLADAYVRAQPEGDATTVRNGVILRMLQTVDPHADWITPPSKVGSYVAPADVGLRLETDRARRRVRVITPIRNSPADHAGIRASDVLLSIASLDDCDGKPLPVPKVISTRGRSAAEINAKLLGPPGTRLALSLRQNSGEVFTVQVRREHGRLETVIGWQQKRGGGWDYWLDPDHRIAYVRLTSFGRDTGRELIALVDRLEQQKVRGLILDLRFNPGGLVNPAVETADLFIDTGIISRLRPRKEKEVRFEGKHEGSRLAFPLACLISGDSKASAEIVAACLQDHKRAVVVGERSQGYARVQNILSLQRSPSCELKLTTAIFLRPSGRKLDRIHLPGHDPDEWGVRPDNGHEVPLSPQERQRLKTYLDSREWLLRPGQRDALKDFRDRQRDQALAYLRSRIG